MTALSRDWAAINAVAVSQECSPAHIRFLIEDAQRDIAMLLATTQTKGSN